MHKLFARSVTLQPNNVVVKSGKKIRLGEARALRIAEQARLPVPHVHSAERTADGQNQIRMDYIEGQTLDKLWPKMAALEKKSIARQMRDVLETMRNVPAPPGVIGGCDGIEIRDARAYTTYSSPACRDEAGFNAYLLSSLIKGTPRPIYDAFAGKLRTDHQVVLSHCGISPKNIIVKDGEIRGLIDWEDAGWYPEYWEYVKFFSRPVLDHGDWLNYADEIFPRTYPDELVDYIAISKWQHP